MKFGKIYEKVSSVSVYCLESGLERLVLVQFNSVQSFCLFDSRVFVKN